MTERIGRYQAARRLFEAFPAFRLYSKDEPRDPGDRLLLHPVMGDFARFYLEQRLAEQPDPAERYWAVVEELAAHGDEYVQDAVSASLIEYFAWGTEDEQAALRDAEPLQGPATTSMVAAYDAHRERMKSCTHKGTTTADVSPPWMTRCSACGQQWPTEPRRRRRPRRLSRG